MAAPARRLRVLCLHGFRTSGDILRKQVAMAQWPEALGDVLDMVQLRAGISSVPDVQPASNPISAALPQVTERAPIGTFEV